MLGILSPKYVAGTQGDNFLIVLCTALIAISFDQQHRLETIRIGEVINSRPVSNFELIAGQLIGHIVLIGVPMLCFLFFIVFYGVASEYFSFRLGTRIELVSVFSFIVFDAIPNFAFFGSLSVLLAVILKSRILVLLISLSFLFGVFRFGNLLPLSVSGPLQTNSGNHNFPSEIAPTLFNLEILVNRLALLLFTVGFLVASATLLGRKSRSTNHNMLLAGLSMTTGPVLIAILFGIQASEHKQVEHWIEVHDENFIPVAFPDIQEIRGEIDIKPGRSVSLNLTIDMSVETNHDSEFILFSFNPGYRITALAVAGNEIQDYKFTHGLLQVPIQHFSTGVTSIDISAVGTPDQKFAYLDSVSSVARIIGPRVTLLRLLGTKSSIFHHEFVVLSPGIKWYPTSGTATNEDSWELRPRDFFTIDLEVTVPRSWIVAGPAKRQQVKNTERLTFRFKQTEPIPEIALVGSKFEQAALEINGTHFEILYSKAHSKTIEAFAPAINSIHQRLETFSNQLTAKGFKVPFGVISLVEVPSEFRVFGGGTRKDTIMNPPGLILVRECSLFTVPVQGLLPSSARDEVSISDQTWIEWQFNSLSHYLQLPAFESNPTQNFYKNLLTHQTNATGQDAYLLNALVEKLSLLLFSQYDDQFDFHLAINPSVLNLERFDPVDTFFIRQSPTQFDIAVNLHRRRQSIADSPTVWEYVEASALPSVRTGEHSVSATWVARFRSDALAELLLDTFDAERLANTLIELRNRFRGKNFTYTEFETLLREQGVDINGLAGDLVKPSGLPGFAASHAATRQYESGDPPTTYYHVKFNLNNREPVSGPIALSLIYHRAIPNRNLNRLPPFLVESNQSLQVEIVSRYPIKYVWIEPYLSLNRMDLRLELPDFEDSNTPMDVHRSDARIHTINEINQEVVVETSIVIDDLDPGFKIKGMDNYLGGISNIGRRLFGTPDVIMDQGLPVFHLVNPQSLGNSWERKEDPTAFGIYRRTFSISRSGAGVTFAEFTTEVPYTGDWRLEYYLPLGNFHEDVVYMGIRSSRSFPYFAGKVLAKVRNGTRTTTNTLDLRNQKPGWYSLGDYSLTDEEVTVSISDVADEGNAVFADAIRWTPIEKVQ